MLALSRAILVFAAVVICYSIFNYNLLLLSTFPSLYRLVARLSSQQLKIDGFDSALVPLLTMLSDQSR